MSVILSRQTIFESDLTFGPRNYTQRVTGCILLALLLNLNAHGQGTLLWNESVNGPFSQSSSTPTILGQLALGTNTIIGVTEVEPTGPSWSIHPDFFTFQVPSNSSIT